MYLKEMAKLRRKHPGWGLKRRKKYAASYVYRKKNR